MDNIGYEKLAAEVIAYAIRDYRRLKRTLLRVTSEKDKMKTLLEMSRIKNFLLSEKFNYTNISGEHLFYLADNENIRIPRT